MKEMKFPRKYMIEKRKTTITVRLGTKYRLDGYKEKSESYDDTITRLLSELEKLRKEKEEQQTFIRDNIGELPNRIEFLELKRSRGALNLTDMTVYYTYNRPPDIPPPDGYVMSIEVEEIRPEETPEKPSTGEIHPMEAMEIYLLIVSAIIGRHFDKTYYPPSRFNSIDRHYWDLIFQKYGIPWSSYHEDIEDRIDRFENEMNEMEEING